MKSVQVTHLPPARKKFFLNQRNKGAAIEKPLFVDRGCLEMDLPKDNNYITLSV